MGDDGSYKRAGCSSRGAGSGWGGRTCRSWWSSPGGCAACRAGPGCGGAAGPPLSEQRAQGKAGRSAHTRLGDGVFV